MSEISSSQKMVQALETAQTIYDTSQTRLLRARGYLARIYVRLPEAEINASTYSSVVTTIGSFLQLASDFRLETFFEFGGDEKTIDMSKLGVVRGEAPNLSHTLINRRHCRGVNDTHIRSAFQDPTVSSFIHGRVCRPSGVSYRCEISPLAAGYLHVAQQYARPSVSFGDVALIGSNALRHMSERFSPIEENDPALSRTIYIGLAHPSMKEIFPQGDTSFVLTHPVVKIGVQRNFLEIVRMALSS
ncbi:hypothetical protein JNM87_04855 [Candidatus Saccharibacteria bacterium]|nr:hypothetical protein [Candidatus Saccharibacteria bacterium]